MLLHIKLIGYKTTPIDKNGSESDNPIDRFRKGFKKAVKKIKLSNQLTFVFETDKKDAETT